MISILEYSPTGSDIALNPIIKVKFSEQVDPVSINKLTCLVADIYGAPVDRAFDYDSNLLELSIYPIGLLTKDTTYTVFIKGLDGINSTAPKAIKSLAGNYLEETLYFKFKTGEEIDNTYPFVTKAVEPGFQRTEGALDTNSFIVSEIGEPVAIVEGASSLNYSGDLIDTANGPAVFLEGVYQADTMPPKTDIPIEVIDYYPKNIDFTEFQQSFIVYFNDALEAWVRNTYGMSIYGESFYEDFDKTIRYYIKLWNYVPYKDSYSLTGNYSEVTYDIDYIQSLNAVRLTITNPTGWNAKTEANIAGMLDWNSLYILNVRTGLEGLTTQPLIKTFTNTYSTPFYPYYCDILTIRQNSRFAFEDDYDDTELSTLIFKASLEADDIMKTYSTELNARTIRARRKYVCCLVRYWLLIDSLSQSGGLAGLSETLGDYSYKAGYASGTMKPLMDDVTVCIEKNAKILTDGYNIAPPTYAERNKNNIRQPRNYRWYWNDSQNGHF